MREWSDCFPEGKEPRTIQVNAIQFILKTFFTDNKKYCILEAPVGIGKSYISATMAKYFQKLDTSSKSYIITPQILLQQQYKQQFDQFANISSRTNYPCIKNPKTNCAFMTWMHLYSNVSRCPKCYYETIKQNFVKSNISITNTSFFMYNLQYAQNVILPRKFLVIDESHNLQEQIIQFVGLQLELQNFKNDFDFDKENWIKQKENVITWLTTILSPFIVQKVKQYQLILQQNKDKISRTVSSQRMIEYSKKYDYLSQLIIKINKIVRQYNPKKWVADNKFDKKAISILPLSAKDYSEDLFFSMSDKVLLMSGTILDKEYYCQSLGISEKDCNFISLDSPFPVKNRKIFISNVGSMSYKNLQETLPKMYSQIKKILEKHKGQRGIIHVSSHSLATKIKNGTNSDRLIIVDNYNNRQQMLEHHFNSQDTVLLSPSLTQGLDLKNDLSRFQIIAKVPFPNLADQYIKRKKELKNWYSYQTAKTIVQAYGRSIRSANDFAQTYILDSDFIWFLKNNLNLFPNYFLQSLQL